jgi:hypothetical protein
MSDESMAFSREIRKAAGVGASAMAAGVGASAMAETAAAARERIETARASGDPAAIEAATREADEVVAKIEGTASHEPEPDFGAGAGNRRSVAPEPNMSRLMRQAVYGPYAE